MPADYMIKKNSFLQQNQENPAAAAGDENAKFTSFLQKMIGNLPANANANANPNIKGNNSI